MPVKVSKISVLHSRALQTSGIFLHNAAEQWVDISYNSSRPQAYFMVESASLDLFLFSGPTVKEVIRQFTALTGTTPLPPVRRNITFYLKILKDIIFCAIVHSSGLWDIIKVV